MYLCCVSVLCIISSSCSLLYSTNCGEWARHSMLWTIVQQGLLVDCYIIIIHSYTCLWVCVWLQYTHVSVWLSGILEQIFFAMFTTQHPLYETHLEGFCLLCSIPSVPRFLWVILLSGSLLFHCSHKWQAYFSPPLVRPPSSIDEGSNGSNYINWLCELYPSVLGRSVLVCVKQSTDGVRSSAFIGNVTV